MKYKWELEVENEELKEELARLQGEWEASKNTIKALGGKLTVANNRTVAERREHNETKKELARVKAILHKYADANPRTTDEAYFAQAILREIEGDGK